jgi:hypothetical protein
MRPFIAALLVVALTTVESPGAVRGDRAAYIGGTAPLKQGTQGKLDISRPAGLVFTAKESTLTIPYQSVISLEFGQKIGRRVGATIALGVTTLGIGALPVLFSKKKRHYLTVGYTENGTNQAVVFELAKDTVRTTLATLEARTGREVERDDTADQDKPSETTARARTLPAPPASSLQPQPSQPAAPAAQVQPAAQVEPVQPAATASGPTMTNVDVVRMVQAGVSEDVILAAIGSCQPRFSFLPAELEGMTRAGVSDAVIKAMAVRSHGR